MVGLPRFDLSKLARNNRAKELIGAMDWLVEQYRASSLSELRTSNSVSY